MREVDGIYGGEMSAHHYFRDFSYADSGMIPWLLVAELMSVSGKSLSELVGERMAMYPASGEINRQVEDAAATLQALHDRYAGDALFVDDLDGSLMTLMGIVSSLLNGGSIFGCRIRSRWCA